MPRGESEAVAARFPDPPVSYHTPAFEPGHAGFTSNAELHSILHAMQHEAGDEQDGVNVQLLALGGSQTGIPLEALHISQRGATSTGVPRATVLLVGQQHGDEPAGAEALLVIAAQLVAGPLRPLLDRIDVVIQPRANPDGAAASRRLTASGIDANRDQLLLRTPEAQAQAQLLNEFEPIVVVDAHEFSAFDRSLEKFAALPRADALIQYAMVANMSALVTRASQEWFRQPMLQSLKAQGLATEWYHTTSDDIADKRLSMGGVQPDTLRNVAGLRNAVSLLIETRGVGLGRAHLLRRVHTQVIAIDSVLRAVAARADDLLALRRFADRELAAQACQGEATVEAETTPSEYTLSLLDPLSGADRTLTLAWDSALELTVTKRRPRPCGYWLGSDQLDAVMHLRGLGVQVQRLDEPGALRGETYREATREFAARSDARASIADAGGVLRRHVVTTPALLDVQPGGYYIGLDQPLANLVIALLEPDTESSFAANRIIDSVRAEARILQRPLLRLVAVQ